MIWQFSCILSSQPRWVMMLNVDVWGKMSKKMSIIPRCHDNLYVSLFPQTHADTGGTRKTETKQKVLVQEILLFRNSVITLIYWVCDRNIEFFGGEWSFIRLQDNGGGGWLCFNRWFAFSIGLNFTRYFYSESIIFISKTIFTVICWTKFICCYCDWWSKILNWIVLWYNTGFSVCINLLTFILSRH